jgi:curved DNA-binding protein CbpA
MATDPSDYYAVLEVLPTADRRAIHASYRRLARTLHPDASGDDAAMKVLNVAWSVLRDPHQRAQYDFSRGSATRREWSAEPIPLRTSSDAVTTTSPSGPAMTYGRYEGWSLGEIAVVDRPFLEWLRGVPGGRHLRKEIDAALAERDSWRPTLGGRRASPSAGGA